mgnify:FL=1
MQEIVEKLKTIGMTENEAKVYAVLFELKVATAREIHEISKVPRNKVYEALSRLEEKGFVGTAAEEGTSRYFIHDISKTFTHLKQASLERLNDVEQYLHSKITYLHNRPMLSHSLQSNWAIESHIRMIFARSKNEIILICHNPAYVKKNIQNLQSLSKKIDLYLIVPDDLNPGYFPIRCYTVHPDLKEFMNPQIREGPGSNQVLDLTIHADRMDTLIIGKTEGHAFGIFSADNPSASILAKYLLKNIKPLTKETGAEIKDSSGVV